MAQNNVKICGPYFAFRTIVKMACSKNELSTEMGGFVLRISFQNVEISCSEAKISLPNGMKLLPAKHEH